MKKFTKITAGALAASLLGGSLALPGHLAFADAAKSANVQKETSSTGKALSWDKSSLVFTGQNDTPDSISAVIENGQDSRDMEGTVTYEIYWAADGNPKNGEVVYTGTVDELASGESQTLTYIPSEEGNYIFKAYQRPNHPGKGELWSEAIPVTEVNENYTILEPEQPYNEFFKSHVDKGTVTFTVPEGMKPAELSFTSYRKIGDGNQTSYDNQTALYGPGTYTVQVDLPSGDWQTDLYLGPVIENITEAGHPLDKFIDSDFGSNKYNNYTNYGSYTYQ
ncbi:hypothetical protein M3221_15995 [Domibacillus indicus]|uniref:hypothetical protein n=1 Tax=Domibacillus indicus TaxID=1437523 RepID=UPI00203B540E|nr:hypothetical protein [Domibacillus indicus]MCM3789895.1 hypothetical protein [Domibacillus indicus]